MNLAQLEVKLLHALPTMQDDVYFKVKETSDDVFLIAMGKRSLPWKERFCQITIGTWGLTDEETEDLIDIAVKDLILQAGDRGFFITKGPSLPSDLRPPPPPDHSPTYGQYSDEYVAGLMNKVLDLEEQLERSDRMVNAVQKALEA